MTELDEGNLAAQLRAIDLIEPRVIWHRGGRPGAASLRLTATGYSLRRSNRLLLALAVAALLALLGGSALALSSWTRPAFVHGKPITQSQQGGFSAHMGWPGHPIQVSVGEASRLAGFKVLTLDSSSSATLNLVTYVPLVVPANQPAPMSGGSVSLDYTIDGMEVQINEGLDPHPSAPLIVSQKIAPGYSDPLCTSVQTIDGGQYIFVRCPDGQTISTVFWKTLDGVDISLVPVMSPVTRPKESVAYGLSMPLVKTVIDHLRVRTTRGTHWWADSGPCVGRRQHL